MMLGWEVVQPIHITLGKVNTSPSEDVDSNNYVDQLRNSLDSVHELAQDSLKTSQERQKQDYDVKLCAKEYNVGDLVYKLNSTAKVGQCKKLQPVWHGPFCVIAVLSPALYKIRDRKHDQVVHHDQLKLCEDRYVPLWMKQI